MPLFKEPVALEACPAKTAESVSYTATFAVLGWLLVSNYSGLTSKKAEDASVANTSAGNAPETSLPDTRLDYLATYIDSYSTNEGSSESSTAFFAGEESQKPIEVSESVDSRLAELSAWHAELDQSRPIQLSGRYDRHERTLGNTNWHNLTPSLAQQYTETFPADLQLSLPLAVVDYPLDNFALEEGLEASKDLASTEPSSSAEIREITVTGAEAERFASRPSHIQRPQVPRAFRALDAQRSLILPPRIQALRP